MLKKLFHCLIFIQLFVFLLTSNLKAITEDYEIIIGTSDSLDQSFLLGKSICKVLKRELEISKLYGGKNNLSCLVEQIKNVNSKKEKLISKEIDFILLNPNLLTGHDKTIFKSLLNFNLLQNNYLLLTHFEYSDFKSCEIVNAINSHFLEFIHLNYQYHKLNLDNILKQSFTIDQNRGAKYYLESILKNEESLVSLKRNYCNILK